MLKERWQPIDKRLDKHIILYNNLTLNMQDEIQSIFNGIKWTFLNANKPIFKAQIEQLDRNIKVWREQGFMPPYFTQKLARLMRKKNISNLELLNVLLEAVYFKRQHKLNDQQMLLDLAKETYIKEMEKLDKKPKAIDDYLIMLMALPNPNGYIWKEYRDATTSYYAQQLQNQVLINLQQGRELNIDNVEFQKVLDLEQKRYLNKKKEPLIDKFSGALDTEVSFMINNAILQAYLDAGIEKVKFVAVEDEKTSQMCSSLANKEFYIDKTNRFYRYSASENAQVLYNIKGLQSGVNLPPINDSFHYCRSSIFPIR
jgi:hypothetical protein